MFSWLTFIGDLLLRTVSTILQTLGHNWYILAFGILTAVGLKTYANTERLSGILLRRSKVSILASVLIGAFTPFCACGTMAVIVGMLTTTLPWGPIMAFLTSSPLMSPDGFVLMSGLLGLRFAVALTVASLAIGLFSGFITLWLEKKTSWLCNQSRYQASATRDVPACGCSSQASGSTAFANSREPAAYAIQTMEAENAAAGDHGSIAIAPCTCTDAACCETRIGSDRISGIASALKLKDFATNFVSIGLRQILLYYSIFVGVGYLVNTLVPVSIVSALFGASNATAVPLAALIGLPLYLTTESGIPMIQSLLQSGASEGAMLAFIITGSATSAWVIAGLSTFMKKRVVGLYVAYIIVGGILSGYVYDFLLVLLHG